MTSLARSIVIDHEKHEVRIDGVPLPWYLAASGPTVEIPDPQIPIVQVDLPLMVDGAVEIRTGERRVFFLGGDGEVGAFARRLVREGLLERVPWLRLDEEDESGVPSR